MKGQGRYENLGKPKVLNSKQQLLKHYYLSEIHREKHGDWGREEVGLTTSS